jgi:hypothetical protein
MKNRTSFCSSSKSGLLCTLAAWLFAAAAFGAPITCTGFTITDGQIGSWKFHNARVYLTFESDTANVQFLHVPIDPSDLSQGTVDVYLNPTGKASVTIISGKKVVRAHLAPNQILMTLDLGNGAGSDLSKQLHRRGLIVLRGRQDGLAVNFHPVLLASKTLVTAGKSSRRTQALSPTARSQNGARG